MQWCFAAAAAAATVVTAAAPGLCDRTLYDSMTSSTGWRPGRQVIPTGDSNLWDPQPWIWQLLHPSVLIQELKAVAL